MSKKSEFIQSRETWGCHHRHFVISRLNHTRDDSPITVTASENTLISECRLNFCQQSFHLAMLY